AVEEERSKKKYLLRPTNRRVDFNRLIITHPFSFPWRELIDGWIKEMMILDGQQQFSVLRDRIQLRKLDMLFGNRSKKSNRDVMDELLSKYPGSLVPIRLVSIGKGLPKSKAIICIPNKDDLIKIGQLKTLNESETIPKTKSIRERDRKSSKEEP